MNRSVFATLLCTLFLLVGCTSEGSVQLPPPPTDDAPETAPVADTRTVEGELQHFPTDVKSTEAWYGHEFKVGDTPVIPTDAVTRDELMELVGRNVLVTGTWHPGEVWKPSDEPSQTAMPVEVGPDGVTRGEGLQVTSIEKQ